MYTLSRGRKWPANESWILFFFLFRFAFQNIIGVAILKLFLMSCRNKEMSEWIHILGNQGFFCAGRYKYRIGKGKKQPCEVDWNLKLKVWTDYFTSIYQYHLSMYLCFSSLSTIFGTARSNYTPAKWAHPAPNSCLLILCHTKRNPCFLGEIADFKTVMGKITSFCAGI